MKFSTLTQTIILLAIFASNASNATHLQIEKKLVNNLPLSPITKGRIKNLRNVDVNVELLSCETRSETYVNKMSSQRSSIKVGEVSSESLEYLNDTVKTRYTRMRNKVISYVTKKVAIALLNFSVDSFSAENIATYVSDGTQPFLPFKFANGVKITHVTHKGSTIVSRTELPVTTHHGLAIELAFAGMVSAITTVCNDATMVDDLLGRDVLIQYDYYDSNGVFFNSFTING